MSQELVLSLQITLVGMGLVFGAILLLWLIMALLVRWTTEKETVKAAGIMPAVEAGTLTDDEMDRKRRAAAAAVAVARMQYAESNQPHEFPLPSTAIVSAWQAVMRARILNKRGPTR